MNDLSDVVLPIFRSTLKPRITALSFSLPFVAAPSQYQPRLTIPHPISRILPVPLFNVTHEFHFPFAGLPGINLFTLIGRMGAVERDKHFFKPGQSHDALIIDSSLNSAYPNPSSTSVFGTYPPPAPNRIAIGKSRPSRPVRRKQEPGNKVARIPSRRLAVQIIMSPFPSYLCFFILHLKSSS